LDNKVTDIVDSRCKHEDRISHNHGCRDTGLLYGVFIRKFKDKKKTVTVKVVAAVEIMIVVA
jgi:hypothetical protein